MNKQTRGASPIEQRPRAGDRIRSRAALFKMGWDAVVVAAGGTGAPPPPHSIRRSIRVTDPPFTAAGPPPCDNDVPVGGRVCLACKKGSVGRCSEVRDGAGRCGAVSGGVGRCGGRGAVRGRAGRCRAVL